MRTEPVAATDDTPTTVWIGRLGWIVLFAALAQVLLAAARLIRYTGPVADEMILTGQARAVGVGPFWAELYLTWSGRWSGVGLFLILGHVIDLQANYAWLLGAIQLTGPLAVYAVLSATFGDRLSRLTRAALSLGLFALHWDGQPALNDSYYWITGAIENRLSVNLDLLVLAGTIRASRRSWPWWAIAGVTALAVISTGMHQLYAGFLVLALLAGTIIAVRTRATGRGAWIVVSLAAFAGLAVAGLSSGNAARIAAEHPVREFWWLRSIAHWWADLVFRWWVLDLKLWLATLVVVCHPGVAATAPAWLRERRFRWAAVAAAATIGMFAVVVLINWWTFPKPLPERTQSAVYFLFLIGWFTTAYALASGPGMAIPKPAWAALAGCLALALLSSGQYPLARFELISGRAAAFRAAVKQRDRFLRESVAAGNFNPRVRPIPAVPYCLQFAEVVEDPAKGPRWFNMAYCYYYGLHSIHLRHDEPAAGAKPATGPG